MNPIEYTALIARLSRSKRVVFDAFKAHGPMADSDLVDVLGLSRSQAIPRRTELTQEGLVRGVGNRPSADGKKKVTIWDLVPPDEVEKSREIADERGPRRQEIRKWAAEDRIRVAKALLRDPDVQDALRTSAAPTTRRARNRAKAAIAQAQRERAEEIKAELHAKGQLLAFLRARNHVKKHVEAIQGIGFFVDEERERQQEGIPTRIPDWAWHQILELVDEAIAVAGQAYNKVARHLGEEERRGTEIIQSPSGTDRDRPIKVVGGTLADDPATIDASADSSVART